VTATPKGIVPFFAKLKTMKRVYIITIVCWLALIAWEVFIWMSKVPEGQSVNRIDVYTTYPIVIMMTALSIQRYLTDKKAEESQAN